MPTIQSSRDVAAPQAALFQLAQDYELRLVWDPFLREMRFLDGATEADVGVRVWVRAKNGLTMEVRYSTLKPPHHVAMTMTKGPAIFRQFSGSWLFKALSPELTHVVFRYHFSVQPAFLSVLMDPIVSRILFRDMDARLSGLKASAEGTDILARLPRTG